MSADDQAAYRDAGAAFRATVGLSPFEHRIRLATTGTAVRVQEVGAGEPVMFLHGGPNAGRGWHRWWSTCRGFAACSWTDPAPG